MHTNYVCICMMYSWLLLTKSFTLHNYCYDFLRTGGGPPGVLFYKRFFFLFFFFNFLIFFLLYDCHYLNLPCYLNVFYLMIGYII